MRSPEAELAALRAASLDRRLRPLDAVGDADGGVRVRRDGRELVSFASNDYLGLAADERLIAVFREAAARFGVGAGSARLLAGTLAPHAELEARLARVKGTEAALAFGSGFAAATGTIPAVVGKGDVVILDKLCHACLVDGARLSGATLRVFPHNRVDRLEDLLGKSRARLPADGRILVVTESVFSMDGDRARLREVSEAAKRHDALLLVDEAHAFGVLGPQGRGLAAALGLPPDAVDLQLGTLSKAAGVAGGFVAASRVLIDLLVSRARTFLFSTAPPPAVAAAASAALDLMTGAEGDRLRDRLWGNVARFTARLSGIAVPEGVAEPASSAIVPVGVGGERMALDAAERLEQAGFLAPAVRFPTVARGAARLRVTFSAAHAPAEVDALAAALRESGLGKR